MIDRHGPRRAVRRLGTLARETFSLLVPPLCVACEKPLTGDERWLCRACGIALACDAEPRTRVVDIDDRRTLEIRYCLTYTPAVSRVIGEMKYCDKPGIAGLLAPFLAYALGSRVPAGTAAVPVPIHPSKRRERGYNQSNRLARGLAGIRGGRVCDVLVKSRMTVSQTALEKRRRLGNVVGSFKVGDPASFDLDRALLVDDVVTTGSTLRECARTLFDAGAKEVSACAVASSL